MKQGLEKRLSKLEEEYATELDAQRIIVLCVLTADETKRGIMPGLFEMSPEDIASRPWEVRPNFWRPSSLLSPPDQSQSVSRDKSSPMGEANAHAASGPRGEGDPEPEIELPAGLETAEGTDGDDSEVRAPEDPAEQ